MYKGYTLREAREEYAITFFALLHEGYKAKHRDYMMLINIHAVANGTIAESDRKIFLQQLEWAGQDPSDILGSDEDGSSTDEIKKILGG